MELTFVLIAAYLIGSINPAIILCRITGKADPRELGSNNPGATNVYRIAGKKMAVAVLAFDVVKGIVPTWGSYYLGMEPIHIGYTAIATCLGHMFPVFFGFKGGKAVATAFGCMLPVGVTLGLSLLLVWYFTFKKSGYSSLAAIVAVGLSPLFTYIIATKYWLPVTMLAVFIILRHTPNIVRLWYGTEPKSKQRL